MCKRLAALRKMSLTEWILQLPPLIAPLMIRHPMKTEMQMAHAQSWENCLKCLKTRTSPTNLTQELVWTVHRCIALSHACWTKETRDSTFGSEISPSTNWPKVPSWILLTSLKTKAQQPWSLFNWETTSRKINSKDCSKFWTPRE